MKGKKKTNKQVKTDEKQSDYGDCSCQMLDTSLQGVGQSDCSCSQCLEANLQAFNQLKQEEQDQEKQENFINRRGGSTRPASNKQTRGISRNTVNENRSTTKIGGFKSIDRMRETRPKTSIRREQHQHSQAYQNQQSKSPKFSRQCINDYMKITQHRAREYLRERKTLLRSQIQKRSQLKSLIKENLQALRYTAKNLINKETGVEDLQLKNQTEMHRFNWGHKPYHCKSRVQCRKLKTYQPNLQEKKQQIQKINKRIKQYIKQNKQKPYECLDKCPKHHMRTSQQKIKEIQKFIKKNANAYKQAQEKAKKQKLEKQKIKEAKLRAIDLKCKQKVAISKKYDQNEQRTSFHNSIDHFSTFSQLRANNVQKMQQKKKRKKLKEALKDGKQLQEAIYQNLQEDLIDDHPPIHSKINVESRYVQGQSQQEQWCQKIVKDARIKPPKDLKKEDKDIKKKKDNKKIEKQRQNNANKSNKHLSTRDLKKQQQRRKEIEAEIQRKKQQILMLYQKRNSTVNKNDPKNKILREQYQQQIKHQTRQSNKNHPKPRQQEKNDPYRQNYKHQASRDPKQMNIIGDPLMQEYQYQQKSKRARQLQVQPANKQIFMNSGKQLMQKKVLKV